MTTNQPIDEALEDREAEERLQVALTHRQEIVTALRHGAANLPSALRQRMFRLSERMRSDLSLNDAIRDVDALAVLVPLARQESPINSPRQIDAAVAVAMTNMPQASQASRGGCSLLIYPSMILALTALIFVGYSLFLVPIFGAMFKDFDLELPIATNLVLSVSDFLRTFLIPIVAVFAAMLILILVALVWVRSTSSGARMWGRVWKNRRVAMSGMAWHLALLIDAGFSRRRALEIAGDAAGHSQARREAEACGQALSSGTGTPPLSANAKGLLFQAMLLEKNADTISLLRELASIHGERQSRVSHWGLALLTPLTVVLAGTLAVTMLAALLMPLVSLISALG
ncbi:MAG: hypothetical protein R3C05_11290 [Pirellulaceae bacterium]